MIEWYSKPGSVGLCLAVVLACTCWPPRSLSGDEEKVVKLPAILDDGLGFSFRAGKPVPLKDDSGQLSPDIDFVWDPPTGLVANNPSACRFLFSGKGGFLDLGKKKFGEVKEVPKEGYKSLLEPEQLKVGHTYAVLTANGKQCGKLHVVQYDAERKVLEFTFQFQAQ